MRRALLFGLAQTNEAVARQLVRRGVEVVVADDHPTAAMRSLAARLGVELVEAPDEGRLSQLVAAADVVLPSPGVPAHHPSHRLARAAGRSLWSEFELAARWGHPPLVAITGTNGKTTVTTLVLAMLERTGRSTVAAGNNELPLVDALDQDLDVIVVEASSYRLDLTETFRPVVGTWLNLSPDHFDWHGSLEAYAAAKAKIWAHQTKDDVAVANRDDPTVLAAAQRVAPGMIQTFGAGDVEDGRLLDIVDVAELPLRRPHDLSNAAAAVVTATAAGVDGASCAEVLRDFTGLPHRVELIGDAGGVEFYDDSKATTPASVLAALSGFDSVVLIAGGRNKGLDLTPLAGAADRVRAVVAIGEAAPLIEKVFAGIRPVVEASSMDDAVRTAHALAEPGDAVLLSPGGASQDWYRSYGDRGDDFARAVAEFTSGE